MHSYTVLATDYDGTAAEHGVIDAATARSLEEFKAAGGMLVLATGREMQTMRGEEGFPMLSAHVSLFDAVVVENGAGLYFPASGRELAVSPPFPDDWSAEIRAAFPMIVAGRSILALSIEHEQTMRAFLADKPYRLALERNGNSLMLTMAGIDKGAGLARAAKELDVSLSSVIAVGNDENDISMFKVAGAGVAVANALPEVQLAARYVMSSPSGAGVRELIGMLLHGTLEQPSSGGEPAGRSEAQAPRA